MTELLSIIQNWSTSSDDECQTVNESVYKIMPEWSNSKLMCTLVLNDQYAFYKEKCDTDGQSSQCVLYNTKTGYFSLQNTSWRNFIPEHYQTIQTFSMKSLFGKEMMVVFFKYTGLYGVYISRNFGYCCETYFDWFENRKILDECVTYCQTNSSFTLELNEVGDKETEYSFDSLELTNRFDRWMGGEWKKMDENGINIVMHEKEFHVSTKNEFIDKLDKFREEKFRCAVCSKKDIFRNFFHCIDCITWKVVDHKNYNTVEQNAYNECQACHTKSSDHQHAMVIPANDSNVLNKYLEQLNEVDIWNQKKMAEDEYTKSVQEKHFETQIGKLNNILMNCQEKQHIMDFVNEKNDYQKYLVIKDPNLVFEIGFTYGCLTIFAIPELFHKWLATVDVYDSHIIYLTGFTIEESSNAINICLREKSCVRIITSTDYVPTAVNLLYAFETWKDSFYYMMVIGFCHTGQYGLAYKTYTKISPDHIKKGLFFFESEDVMDECHQHLRQLIDFNCGRKKGCHKVLNQIIDSMSYANLLENRKNDWYNGEYHKTKPFPAEITISNLETFKNEMNFIKPMKKQLLNLTRC